MYNPNKDKKQNPTTFNGFWRGEVVDDNDPTGNGRIRVRIFGVYDDVPNSAIPWAIMADPLMGGQSGLGGVIVPDQGSHVWCFFEQGDHEQPVYFAGAPAAPDGPQEANTNGAYPRNKVFKTKAGHLIEIDDSEGGARIRIQHNSGTYKETVDSGSVNERIVNNLSVYVEGNVGLTVEGNVTEEVMGDVNRTILGNVYETINGDFETTVLGNRVEQVAGNTDYLSDATITINGERVNVN